MGNPPMSDQTDKSRTATQAAEAARLGSPARTRNGSISALTGWLDALRDVVHRTVHSAEQDIDAFAAALRERLGRSDPIMIQAYRGFGDEHELWLRGRVLEDEGIRAATDQDTVWQNLLAMYLRFESDEVPGTRVVARSSGTVAETTTDEEGYFEVRLPVTAPNSADPPPWREIELELPGIDGKRGAPVRALGHVRVPHPDAAFGVISDIDDTILRSEASSLLTLARSTLLHNARTRLPFEGVAAFYRALEHGTDTAEEPTNPFFYVSSSPWNLYGFIEEFFEIHALPRGPLLLRDLGIDESKFVASGHDHKLEKIEHVLGAYPDLPFVLVGDSGQDDPEIYRHAVEDFPGRIRTIYIRHVSDDARSEEIAALVAEVARHDIEMLLVPDTLAAARHAAAAGLIDEDRVADIGADKRRDEGMPEA
jgi:phosphatidate phosphatase APP1